VYDQYAPANQVYFLNRDYLHVQRLSDDQLRAVGWKVMPQRLGLQPGHAEFAADGTLLRWGGHA
jgi:hypothetical protein